MAKKGKELNGFMALKAAQRAAQDARAARGEPPFVDPAAKPATPSGKTKTTDPANKPIASRARKTVLPTRYEVICYECGFSFSQTGRSRTTNCPKCRAVLEFADLSIDGVWKDTIKTAGKVTIQPDGAVTGGSIFAGDIIVRGRITGGSCEAYRCLEIREQGAYDPACVKAKDLRITKDAQLILAHAHFRNVEISGSLKTALTADELVHIKSGGYFSGSITGHRLRVDDGAALQADLDIQNH
jgi:cytoskeletal protein CcmA (bactofilin family)